jgi:hypothetical protein
MVELEAAGLNDERARSPMGLEFARALIVRALDDQMPGADRFAGALHHVCTAVCSNLRASLGEDGCRALFGRAFVAEDDAHPALRTIRGPDDCEIPLERIVASIEAHGADPTKLALEAVVANVVDILARLIGADMTMQMLDPETHRHDRSGGAESP